MVRLEEEIVHHYAKVIPDITLPIVSALAFETSSWRTQYLEWTTEWQPKDKAIADAVLRLDPDFPQAGSPHHDCPYTSLNRENNKLLSEGTPIRDEVSMPDCLICDHPARNELKNVVRYFRYVMLYEFKNLLAGSYEHMIALLDMTRQNTVHWEGCDRRTCKHDTIEFRVTGSRTGFDAASPLVQLRSANWTKPLVELEDKHRSSAKRILQQVKTSCQFYTGVLNSNRYGPRWLRMMRRFWCSAAAISI